MDLVLPVDRGDLKEVKRLLEAGADPNQATYDMWGYPVSCLYLAVKRGDFDMVEALVEAGADVNSRNGESSYTPVMRAVDYMGAYGDKIFKYLLSKGADLYVENSFKQNCFIYAVRMRSEREVKALLEVGMNPNHLNSEDNTPLFEAILYKRFSMIKPLLEGGADPNLQDKIGNMSLHCAVMDCYWEFVVELLMAGGDPTLKKQNGETAYDVARRYGKEKLFRDMQKRVQMWRREALLVFRE